jgi:integrase/recombinase XerD
MADLTSCKLSDFQGELATSRTTAGRELSRASQCEVLTSVRSFLGWAAAARLVSAHLSDCLDVPHRGERVPRVVFSAREAEQVLAQADCTTTIGLRDRALMELLYSTGVRRTECIHLTVPDVDHERGVVLVREGKGSRDRLVPVGERALCWLARYLWSARPLLASAPDTGVLFVNRNGKALLANRLSERVHRYIQKARLGKSGSCHTFRHTMATLLLEGGADIRHIQAMLGHVHLSTTALYTRVSMAQLKLVHSRAHPAERGAWPDSKLARGEVELEFDLLEPE